MIIDCISDLHGFYPELEGGDLLIVTGDLTARDTYDEYGQFFYWLKCQNYKTKIFIGGNHDNLLLDRHKGIDDDEEFISQVVGDHMHFEDCIYLCDSGTEFEYLEPLEYGLYACEKKTLKIWGSPWTLTFPGMNPHCKAFTVDTEDELAVKFSLIPEDTDILITHSPPYYKGDYITLQKQHAGSESLWRKVSQIKPVQLHVFGHIHEGYGVFDHTFINASHLNERYQPVNKPIRVIL